MSNHTLFWMTGVLILCMLVLFLLNSIPLIWPQKSEKYLKFNDVRGMAVEHKQKLYTLNFKQQNEFVGYFNASLPLEKGKVGDTKPKLEVSKIIIYRFDQPDITIVPMEYLKNNLIFSSPDWSSEGLMSDTSDGALKNLLSQTYDP